jgi:uncharacterized membrane protein
MSNLFVVGFDEPHKAEEVSLKLQELQSEYLVLKAGELALLLVVG